jgi:PAS domain S-box-containing protein/putative nucleotidyltransferase with HDIG domain
MNSEHQENSERISLPDIRMSAEGLSALVKASPLGIIAVDLDGVIKFWNRAAEEITGWREDEVFGRSIEVLSKDQPEVYEEIRQRTLRGEVLTALPLCAAKKDGSQMHISYSVAPVFDAKNRIVGTVAFLYDITERMKLETALKASLDKMNKVVEQTIETLASVVETRDPYTANHQRRVACLACAIAEEMGGIGDYQMKGIQTAAILHDIGKLYVPFEILNKPGHLKDFEFAVIKNHPQAGYEILENIEFPWPVARIVQQHHERLDGSGEAVIPLVLKVMRSV